MHLPILTILSAFLLPLAALADSSFPLLDAALLDDQTFAQWSAGGESAVPETEAKDGPRSIVWATAGKVDWRGIKFGAGRDGDVRHLRIGFSQPVLAGSVLVSGGGVLSVLRADAAYPGDLANDAQWLPAERLVNGEVSRTEVTEGAYAVWVLPTGTSTRALRFSHRPAAADKENAGVLGGAWLLPQRLANVAPQALAQSVARDDISARLIDESHNGTWQTWENAEQGRALPVTSEHPEVITLTWPSKVSLSGVCLLWTGFPAAEVETFSGGETENVAHAAEASWQRVGSAEKLETYYPVQLGPHWLAFAKPVVTRALRLKITAGFPSAQGHLEDKVKGGRRVWLGEIMALAPLADDRPLASLRLPKHAEEPPPIPIHFTLPQAGVVTLVIEDLTNHRVRNLVSETPFPAGENTTWWDGSDDLLRDPEAARHGVYNIPTRPVEPGKYKVRGLWHEPLKLHYEFSIYNAGKPAWETADKTGCWMTTHTPPTSIATIPGAKMPDGQPLVLIGAFVAEGGHGLQWLREDGTKLGGQGWVGGNWTGAPTLAVDLGKQAIPDHAGYVGSVWEGELRLTAKTSKLEDKPVFKSQLGPDPRIEKPQDGQKPSLLEGFDGGDKIYVLAGIAARDGVLVCSLLRQNELLLVDAKAGNIAGKVSVPSPRGVTFDAAGRMLVLSGTQLLRFASVNGGPPQRLISQGLEDPRQLCMATTGEFYITDRGNSHQVKVFSAEGKFLRSLGDAGAPALGKYNANHLNNPNGIALDSQGRLWVAEADNYPRRVSLWTAEGKLVRAFYGPTEYGGGGVLDAQDAARFFYKGMEFTLDWKTGTDQLQRVFARPEPILEAHGGFYSPDYPLYPQGGKGRRYFTSCYTHNPTGGDHAAFIWRDEATAAKLVAGLGDAHHWEILRTPEFRSCWPEGTKPEEPNPPPDRHAAFVWADLNDDGRPQPNEVKMVKETVRGITVMNDLSFIASRFGDVSAQFAPTSLTTDGTPSYELQPRNIGPCGGAPPSSGGDQTLRTGDWTLNTNAALPFSPYSLGGSFQGEPRWSYPSAWPGLHASHEAAVPDRPGMVIGHTRLLGDCIQSKLGPLFGVNENMGNMALFTADGLFVANLFNDIRLRPNWAAPVATRDMEVTDVSLHDENFWPSMTQTPEGKVFLIDGGRTSLVRVDGLETLQRIPEQEISVTPEDLAQARDWFTRAEITRQQARGTGVLSVSLTAQAPLVDGQLTDWPITTDWAIIDRRGTKANFNSDSRPYEVSAAVCLSGDKLYAAWRTTEKDLLKNTGDTPNALFKTGGCLDVMLQAETEQRLLITLVKGQPRAMLYRAKVPGTEHPVAFSSPWRTIQIDAVEDVSDQLRLDTDNAGNYEISISLTSLHWHPKAGDILHADLGILRGSNGQTTQRVYWANKATAITADVPSEAELTPKLWGTWRIAKAAE